MVADLVAEWGKWVGLIVGLMTIVAGIYAGVKWARAQLRSIILEDVTPRLDEQDKVLADQDVSLKHLHDCVETVGREAVAHAKTAATAADGAAEAATKAETAAAAASEASTKAEAAITAHFAVVEDHIQQDNVWFGEIKEWRDRADIALRNIQQATIPPD